MKTRMVNGQHTVPGNVIVRKGGKAGALLDDALLNRLRKEAGEGNISAMRELCALSNTTPPQFTEREVQLELPLQLPTTKTKTYPNG